MKWGRFIIRAIISMIGAIVVLLAAVEVTPVGDTIWTALGGNDAVGTLLAGWIGFLRTKLPQVTVSRPAVIAGATIFVLFTVFLDVFARWCCRAASRRPGAAQKSGVSAGRLRSSSASC